MEAAGVLSVEAAELAALSKLEESPVWENICLCMGSALV
jgi:hypothetical protein